MDFTPQSSLPISVEQSKLLGNAKRIKIIAALQDKPKTAKQVADELKQTPGSIHYHIQKLYEGGLIDLVDTQSAGGIIEKYYKAKAAWYSSEGAQFNDPALAQDLDDASRTLLSLRLYLSPVQREELVSEFRSFLEQWVQKTADNHEDNSQEFAIGVKVVSTEQES
ncbi:MAG: winged helix-turn-helix domain-containing protein [Paenibacillus dendritiformis]|uniref:winged helix-turn-helix domain-containing protein n=1 Tax=Paenibacillus dendritiformis TaxID=130049 RepID=UPI00143D9ABA|nr:winged helix-turn-helix domain-containing protein [Paenibacillus dendritiformis]MDU5143623.1 winged helix-turn-helix domain-containing protein [Paenibacillus dendritiformis]NKI24513.1 winged helix-turn-helix transcriptional regulator [Paenibacillus dendritiformis]NRG01357.1 winged helix-turn-helix transcriptional regulator [Paenibacillus dendritiformis]